jgi:hypothetical protein
MTSGRRADCLSTPPARAGREFTIHGASAMTEHLPATTRSRTPTLGLQLDAKLNDLLLSAESPVVGPNSAAALRVFAAEPEPPLVTEPEVETMIGKLAIATAQPKVSEAEANERLSMYYLALKDLPVADLRQAFVELLRTSTFLPTPAEVRTAALKAGALRRYTKSRARHLVWKHEQEWRPESDIVPPEELSALLATVKVSAA